MKALTLLVAVTMFGVPCWARADDPPAPVADRGDASSDAQSPGARRHCLRETGSRLPPRAEDREGCLTVPGRSYDREEIDRTGAITPGDALQRLDPSVTIRR